ncbi:MAG: precorrin-4 C(11)-methyltransferase [Syntrophobacterales bacterium]|nr:precorrin-4 C(11)-methyltransferase [Syntrophobacterales bacterium]
MMHPVIFVGAGPGDPELITVKGQRALAGADLVVYAGSLVSPAVLAWAAPGAELIDSAPLSLEEIIGHLLKGYRAGRRVVRLHSGDPALFGALQEQLALLDREGVPYRIIPGVTAACAAAAALQRELTLPEVTQTVILTRAAGRTPVPAREALGRLAQHGATLAIYLSAHLVEEVTRELQEGYPPDTPVAIAYRVSWPEERLLTCTLAELPAAMAAAGITRQALILVGPALGSGPPAAASRLYDSGFSHGRRPGRKPR